MRVVSGAGDAYTLFAFPPEIPLHCYMHGIPDIRSFCNNGKYVQSLYFAQVQRLISPISDVLSFYKEEAGGESANQISILARCEQVPKIEVLRRIADSVADAHARLMEILAPQPAALRTYLQFSCGYVGFHTSLKRYRLGELYNY